VKETLITVCIVAGLIIGSYEGYERYEDHVAESQSSVETLPAAYIKPSATFLRQYDALVKRQQSLTYDATVWRSKIPDGYIFDVQMRAFKPAPPQAQQGAK
jgi:hypothetical protein